MANEVGVRLREFRTRDSVTQRDVAEVLGVDASQVSRAEQGERHLSGFELGLLSEAFGWDVRDLLGMERPREKLAVATRLRAPDGDVAEARRRAGDLIEADAILDGVISTDRAAGLSYTQVLGEPGNEAEAVAQGSEVAAIVRDKFGASGALTDLVGFLEDELGADVLVTPLENSCDGIVAFAGTSVVVVIDSEVMSGRQRFTLAHELGHGVMGDVTHSVLVGHVSNSLVEKRAHAFASALLMPADDLRRVLGDAPGAKEMAEAMAQFGVSWSALRKRCQEIGVAVDPGVVSLSGADVFASAGRANDVARLAASMAPRPPSRLVRRVSAAYADALVGPNLVAMVTGLVGAELDEELERVRPRFLPPEPIASIRG